VLAFTVDAQRQHGLRHDDFLRYRQYCARRLERLRHALKFTQGRKQFSKKPVTRERASTDVRYLAIVLVNAERVRVRGGIVYSKAFFFKKNCL